MNDRVFWMVLNDVFFVFGNRIECIIIEIVFYDIDWKLNYVICGDFCFVVYWMRNVLVR